MRQVLSSALRVTGLGFSTRLCGGRDERTYMLLKVSVVEMFIAYSTFSCPSSYQHTDSDGSQLVLLHSVLSAICCQFSLLRLFWDGLRRFLTSLRVMEVDLPPRRTSALPPLRRLCLLLRRLLLFLPLLFRSLSLLQPQLSLRAFTLPLLMLLRTLLLPSTLHPPRSPQLPSLQSRIPLRLLSQVATQLLIPMLLLPLVTASHPLLRMIPPPHHLLVWSQHRQHLLTNRLLQPRLTRPLPPMQLQPTEL